LSSAKLAESFPLPAEKAFQVLKGSQPDFYGSLVTLKLDLTFLEAMLSPGILTQACEGARTESHIEAGFLGGGFQPEGYIHAVAQRTELGILLSARIANHRNACVDSGSNPKRRRKRKSLMQFSGEGLNFRERLQNLAHIVGLDVFPGVRPYGHDCVADILISGTSVTPHDCASLTKPSANGLREERFIDLLGKDGKVANIYNQDGDQSARVHDERGVGKRGFGRLVIWAHGDVAKSHLCTSAHQDVLILQP
jgi:hypothetical protein